MLQVKPYTRKAEPSMVSSLSTGAVCKSPARSAREATAFLRQSQGFAATRCLGWDLTEPQTQLASNSPASAYQACITRLSFYSAKS